MGGEERASRREAWLAFDTSGADGSVAVARMGDAGSGPDVLSRVLIEERLEQAARLVPAIDEALRTAGVDRGGIGGIVIGEGPGSFTGVRVAAATAKGLAHALGCPLRAVSSLAAAALAHDAGSVRYVLFDARADRVYGACYGVGSRSVQELVAPHPGTLRDVLAAEVPAGAVFVGEGSRRHAAVIEGAGFEVDLGPRPRSLAEGLAQYLSLAGEAVPVVDAWAWEPAYIREWSVDAQWSG